MKARSMIVSVFVLLAILLASCAPAATPTTAPAAPGASAGGKVDCSADPFGCAKIPAGQTIKIGMGAPMTGDNAQFGVDISQGAKIAVADAGDVEGFKFELVVQDDGGTPEGGAAVANKFVSDPTIVAIAGHIFSGATAAAMPIYEKARHPHDVALRHQPRPDRRAAPRSSTAWPSPMRPRANSRLSTCSIRLARRRSP